MAGQERGQIYRSALDHLKQITSSREKAFPDGNISTFHFDELGNDEIGVNALRMRNDYDEETKSSRFLSVIGENEKGIVSLTRQIELTREVFNEELKYNFDNDRYVVKIESFSRELPESKFTAVYSGEGSLTRCDVVIKKSDYEGRNAVFERLKKLDLEGRPVTDFFATLEEQTESLLSIYKDSRENLLHAVEENTKKREREEERVTLPPEKKSRLEALAAGRILIGILSRPDAQTFTEKEQEQLLEIVLTPYMEELQTKLSEDQIDRILRGDIQTGIIDEVLESDKDLHKIIYTLESGYEHAIDSLNRSYENYMNPKVRLHLSFTPTDSSEHSDFNVRDEVGKISETIITPHQMYRSGLYGYSVSGGRSSLHLTFQHLGRKDERRTFTFPRTIPVSDELKKLLEINDHSKWQSVFEMIPIGYLGSLEE